MNPDYSIHLRFFAREHNDLFVENNIYYGTGTYQIIISISVDSHIIQQIEEGIFITFEDTLAESSFLKTKNKGLISNQMPVIISPV